MTGQKEPHSIRKFRKISRMVNYIPGELLHRGGIDIVSKVEWCYLELGILQVGCLQFLASC
jgi:hypothetical protein